MSQSKPQWRPVVANGNASSKPLDQPPVDVFDLVNDFYSTYKDLKENRSTPTLTKKQSPISPSTIQKHREIASALRDLGESYLEKYENEIHQMVVQANIEPPNKSFKSLSNVLFEEGIEWKHIATYFVFGAEFAYYASMNGYATMQEVARWQAEFISQTLQPWIKDNGDWVSTYYVLG